MAADIRILYVDDEETLLEVSRLFLERSGEFEVTTSLSAPDALRLLGQEKFDAIISDYQMPGMDGIQFLVQVRARFGSIPFILFTGKGREEVVIQALNSGADFYLQKGGDPVSQFTELAHKTRQAVQHRRAEASIRDHERREADIINFLPDATFAIDRNGIVIAWNKAIEEMTGIPASRMLGKGEYEYALPFYGKRRPILIDLVFSDPVEISDLYSEIVRDGATLAAETTLPHPRGKPRTLWGKASQLFDKDGNVVGALESIRDITERKAGEVELRKAHDVLEDRVKQRTADLYTANLQLQKEIGSSRQIASALKESEERFRVLIEKAPEAILLYDADQERYIEANAKAEQLFGCTRRQLLASGPQQFYLPDQPDGEPVRETVTEHRKLVLAGEELVFERRIRNARNEDRIAEVRLVRLPSPTRKLIRSSFIDITERKRVEAALWEKEEHDRAVVEEDYRVMLENIQDVFYRTDAKGDLVLITPSAAALLGYEGAEEMIGRPATDYYADPAQRDRLLLSLKNGGSVSSVETMLKRKDGSHVIVSTSSHVYYDKAGNYAGVEGIFRDMTRFKQVEEELRQSEEQYRVLVGHIQDGAFMMQDGILQFCNEAFAAMIGYAPEEITGEAMPDLIAPEDRDMVMERQRSRLAGEPLNETYEFRLIHRDGTTRVPVLLSVGIGTYKDRPAVIGTVRDVTRERERERALRESEEKHRVLLDESPDPIFSFSPDGRYTYANKALARTYGREPGDIVGMTIRDFFPEDEADKRYAALEKAFRTGENTVVEGLVRTCDGYWYYLTTITLVKDAGGLVISAICSAKDITGRRQAEEDLRRIKNQYDAIASNIPVGIYIMRGTPEGAFSFDYVSPRLAEMFSVSAERFLADPMAGLNTIYPDDLKDLLKVNREKFNREQNQQPEPFIWEGRAVIRGAVTWIHIESSPVPLENGDVLWNGIVTDVTRRRQVEEALRESEEKFRSIFDMIEDGIQINEFETGRMPGKFLDLNKAACQMLGYTREEMSGQSPLDFVTGYHSRPLDEILDELSTTGHSIFETSHRRRDGTIIPVEINTHIGHLQGKMVAISVIRDITDRKEVEEAFRQANRKLALLSNITRHDINNQVSVLRSYLHLLDGEKFDPPRDGYFREAMNASQRISSMIRFTKEYEAIGVNAPAWQNCRALVDTAAKEAQLGQVIVKNGLPAGDELFADQLIARVFYNLMDNAVQYGGKITTIRFSVENGDGDRIIVCEDDGNGIAEDDKERIFERGFGKNTGLGLAISREILAITGIRIRETGVPGIGARFEMLVPERNYRSN